jgi:Protein kinase domain
MQAGDIIKGVKGEADGIAYLVLQPIGAPGLFGQAFLCRRTDDNSEAVVKTLRAGRPPADRERFFQEASTLDRMADFEQRAGQHYAVRLLDQSALDAIETFLVLERASGQNVLDDILRQIIDWRHAPLEEQRALEIARHLAQALQIAHQAGICYDDMKLDNLFWDQARPDDPLRIIDWNVTSSVAERGVAGDWARFGARLYELCTGQRIGVNRDGTILGEWPTGAGWQQLAEGVRDIITQALGLRYTDDAPLLRDLKRECDHACMAWPDLLERATIADGTGQIIDVLAPIARAERLIQPLLADDPSRAPALAHCADLRQRATLRRGVAGTRALDYAIQSLARNEPKLAVERLQKAYAETGSRDPRPRRWLWVARFATEHAQRYRAVREHLEAGVDALNHDKWQAARERLTLVIQADPDLPIADWLLAEADSLLAEAAGSAEDDVFKHEQLRAVIDQYPDLRAMRDELQQRQADRQRRQAALLREHELWATAQHALAEAEQAEQHGQHDQALHSCARALATLEQMLTDGCTPAIEAAARAMQQQLIERRERLERQELARQLPEYARSPDPHQRAEALRLAEEQLPDWVELPQLREQLGQIDADLAIFERSQAADPAIGIEQTLAALDALEQAGIKLDRRGADLRLARKNLTKRRNAQRNSQARARTREVALAIDEARMQLNRAKCAAALRALHEVDTQEVSADTRLEIDRALKHATELTGLLEQIEQQRAEIERHYGANNWSYACRLAQRLAHDNPQLPRLAEEVLDRERELWRWMAVGARELAAAYRRLSLKEGTALQIGQLEVEAARLNAQRLTADEPIALVAAQREPLRLEADSALADLAQAHEQWHQTRISSLAELSRYLEQAKTTAEQGDDSAARRILIHIRDAYLPPDAREQGMEPIMIRIERLAHELKQRRDSQLTQLHQLEARLNDPTTPLWFEELTEPFKHGAAKLDPEIQPTWERVRDHAERLRQQLVRVSWKEQVASNERLDRLEATLVALGQTGTDSRQQREQHAQQLREQHTQQLREMIERGEQAAHRQLIAMAAEHQQTTTLLKNHSHILIGAFAAQFIVMLALIVIIVWFR